MSEIEFRFFGWYKGGTSDKIWGWFNIGDNVYNFWGPRGENKLVKLSFKQFKGKSTAGWRVGKAEIREARTKEAEKLRKGYKEISVRVEDDMLVDIEKIYPGFTEHLKKSMFIAKLSGNIRGLE